MGKKGGSSGSTQKADPWVKAQPYLLGTNGKTGVFPSAENQYNTSGWSDQMQNASDQYLANLQNRSGLNQGVYSAADSALKGYYDTNITPASKVSSQSVDPTAAFSSMGAANPTSALSQLLSGQADTSALNTYMDSAMGRLTDNFNTSVMPSLRSGAQLSGQYGGSRQGIAEGLAAKGLSQSMSDLAANAYNNAYNTAQSNMYGTANNLSGLALNNATNNANRQLSADQFNSNVQLQNNSQAMQNNAQNLQNAVTGTGLLSSANALDSSNYQNTLSALQSPNAYNWQNLKNYANIISSGAGMGGTSSTSTPTTTNALSSGLGGALAGAQLAGLLGTSTGWGTAIGAGLGLLSDRRFKTDIEPMGKLDNGLTVYRYRYKDGGPLMLGVMADEVKTVNPDAVITKGGIDYVNYGAI